jgi:putative oxidoreductase
MLTPLGAAAITGTMITAIEKAHAKKGPWLTNGGYEYNVVLIGAALALAETGPGSPSIEAALGHERSGPRWALAALAAGAAGAIAVNRIAAAQPPAPAPEPQEPAPSANAAEASASGT